mmetsp:Transcript_11203/g.14483  ORF Transcript_11203/g.14483 Transcript_11203/m.14483 type:complete len:298 (-) Transcript_11203:189-1082(-)
MTAMIQKIQSDTFILPENDSPEAVEYFSNLSITSGIPIKFEDPQILSWTWTSNIVEKVKTRFSNPPRLPNSNEIQVLASLHKNLSSPFEITAENSTITTTTSVDINSVISEFSDNEKLLQRLWSGFYGKDEPYSRSSKKWKRVGFQQIDPISDFRGCGMLPLHCLIYLFEEKTSIARYLYALRSVRIEKRGEFANYPFACAGIALVKTLCGVLKLCNPLTGQIINDYNHTYTTFWHIIESQKLFYELFIWSILVLDNLWDEMEATYMDFGNVLKLASQRISETLNQLPLTVLPSLSP